MHIPYVALRNLGRTPLRTCLLLAILAIITCALFTGVLFIRSVDHALSTGASRLGADILVVPEGAEPQARSALLSGEPTHFQMPSSVIGRVLSVEGVGTATPQLFLKPAGYACCFNVDVFLIAFDPLTDLTVTPWLAKHLKRELGPAEIITGSEVPAAVGDIIPFYGSDFTVAGVREPTGMDVLDRAVFMSLEAGYRMAEDSRFKARRPLEVRRDRISAVLVRLREGASPELTAIRLEHAISGIRAITTSTVINSVKQQLAVIGRVIFLLGLLLGAVLLSVIAFAFTVVEHERRREWGLLRAMGATRSQAASLIVTEAAMLSAAGGVAGVGAGLVMLRVLRSALLEGLKVPSLLPPLPELLMTVTAAIALSTLMGMLASLLPVVSASRREPFEAILSSS